MPDSMPVEVVATPAGRPISVKRTTPALTGRAIVAVQQVEAGPRLAGRPVAGHEQVRIAVSVDVAGRRPLTAVHARHARRPWPRR